MANIADVRKAINDHFITQWSGRSEQFTLDNEPFEPKDIPRDQSWVRLSVISLDSEQETLNAPGHRKFRREGMAIVQVFSPINKGMRAGGDLSSVARAVFEGRSIRASGDPVHFQAVQIREIGRDQHLPLHQINVEARFTFYETL